VAATRIAEGHAVYVRGIDHRLFWRTIEVFTSPGYSVNWAPLPGGTVGSGPDIAQIDSDSVWMAARASNNALLVRRQDGTTFGAWENLGGIITTAPGLAYDAATNRLWAFAQGGDGAVWYRMRAANGTRTPFASIDGIVTSAPDAIVAADGFLRVNVRGGNGNLYRRAMNLTTGAWGPWEATTLAINSAFSAVRSDTVAQINYYRNAARNIVTFTDGPPTNLGGTLISAPDASHNGSALTAVGTNRACYARLGSNWVSMGGTAA
jgi:hypothetical protein